jgi:hypothetical protein
MAQSCHFGMSAHRSRLGVKRTRFAMCALPDTREGPLWVMGRNAPDREAPPVGAAWIVILPHGREPLAD